MMFTNIAKKKVSHRYFIRDKCVLWLVATILLAIIDLVSGGRIPWTHRVVISQQLTYCLCKKAAW